jgi:hypothetical protein
MNTWHTKELEFLDKLSWELQKKFPTVKVEAQPDSSIFVITVLDYRREMNIEECRRLSSFMRQDELMNIITKIVEEGISKRERPETVNFGEAADLP